LPLLFEVASNAGVGHWKAKVFFFATFLGFFRGFVIEQPSPKIICGAVRRLAARYVLPILR
jgi:hypothetical protein